jgi:hypothetical protein
VLTLERSVSTYLRNTEWMMDAEMRPTRSQAVPSRSGAAGLVLAGAAVACLAAGGLLLWGSHGGAVFSEMVLAAVAWCF